jgi:glycine cleavage system regulatory protein
MMDVVLTLIGPDRPGLVEAVAERVTAHGGNWLESRMAQLAGQFAGILRVELPPDGVAALQESLRELEDQGLKVLTHMGAPQPGSRLAMELEAVGQDHPGIVREVSQVLLRYGVNIEELTTDRFSAPMAGGLMFRARLRLGVPAGVDTARLCRDLELIAHDLMVDLKLAQAVLGTEP